MWRDLIFHFMLLLAIDIFPKKLNVDYKYLQLKNYMYV
jgi:hypothetical protein